MEDNGSANSGEMQARIQYLERQLLQTQATLENMMGQLHEQRTSISADSNSTLAIGKPEKFKGQNARAWLMSLENVFSMQSDMTDASKLKYAVSYLAGEGMAWLEMMLMSPTNPFPSFEHFKRELLDHFEPVNKERHARQRLRNIKQIGKLESIRQYNREFAHWLLQVPTMDVKEQLFHYSSGLRRSTQIEVVKADPTSLKEAMQVADRIDTIYASITRMNDTRSIGPSRMDGSSSLRPQSGPVPMQIGNMQSRKLSPQERQRCLSQNLCFVCKKVGCRTANHKSKNDKICL